MRSIGVDGRMHGLVCLLTGKKRGMATDKQIRNTMLSRCQMKGVITKIGRQDRPPALFCICGLPIYFRPAVVQPQGPRGMSIPLREGQEELTTKVLPGLPEE
jgi:hypothetical protein